MTEFFSGLSLLGKVFFISAAGGTFGFLLQLVFQFLLGGDGGLEGGSDVDAGAHGGMSDSDFSFKWLSFQSLTSFMMMFGFVGLAMNSSVGGRAWLSILAATAAGFAAIWVLARLFRLAYQMQSTGNMSIAKAVGQIGSVYLTIPSGGRGQVEIAIDGRKRFMDAVMAENDDQAGTGQIVEVVAIVNGNVLKVKKNFRQIIPVMGEAEYGSGFAMDNTDHRFDHDHLRDVALFRVTLSPLPIG